MTRITSATLDGLEDEKSARQQLEKRVETVAADVKEIKQMLLAAMSGAGLLTQQVGEQHARTMRDVPRANSTDKSSFYHDGRPIEARQGGSLGACSRPRRIPRPPRASCPRIACSPTARPIPAAHHGRAEKEEWGDPLPLK